MVLCVWKRWKEDMNGDFGTLCVLLSNSVPLQSDTGIFSQSSRTTIAQYCSDRFKTEHDLWYMGWPASHA